MVLMVRDSKDRNIVDVEIYTKVEGNDRWLGFSTHIDIQAYTEKFNDLSNGCVDYLWDYVVDTNYINDGLVGDIVCKYRLEHKDKIVEIVRKMLDTYAKTYSIEGDLRVVED